MGTERSSMRGVSRLAPCIAGAAAVIAAAAWALAPLEAPALPLSAPPPVQAQEPVDHGIAALDRSAYSVPLWLAPPLPPAPPPAPVTVAEKPLPPLKIQLLAIIKERAEDASLTYKAMVYDPDTDRVLVVAAGEQLGGRDVERVDAGTLRLKGRDGVRTLTLKTERGAS